MQKEIKPIKIIQFRTIKIPSKNCPKCNGTGKHGFVIKRECNCVRYALYGETNYVIPNGGIKVAHTQ